MAEGWEVTVTVGVWEDRLTASSLAMRGSTDRDPPFTPLAPTPPALAAAAEEAPKVGFRLRVQQKQQVSV